MVNIAFHTAHVPWPFLNQTEDGHGKWHDLQFTMNPPEDRGQFEYLVAYNEIDRLKTRVPKSRRILFIGEPPSITDYPPKYLNQFGIVVCPYPLKGFKGKKINSQTSLPWHFGINRAKENATLMDFHSLEKMEAGNKQAKISVVCSNKTITPEHRLRLEFVQKAKEKLGDRFDIYGRGFTEIDDKAEVVLPYQFHLVLENNFNDHFWTEKLADAYLGLSYPIYSGCRNINEYFNDDMLNSIDIHSMDTAIATLQKILDQPDFYQQHFEAIVKAKQKVMHEYNLFAAVENIVKGNTQKADNHRYARLLKPTDEYRKNKRKLIDVLYSYKVKFDNLKMKKV